MKKSGIGYQTLVVCGALIFLQWAGGIHADTSSARPYPPTTRPPIDVRSAPKPPVYEKAEEAEPLPQIEIMAADRLNNGALGGVVVLLGGLLLLLGKSDSRSTQ